MVVKVKSVEREMFASNKTDTLWYAKEVSDVGFWESLKGGAGKKKGEYQTQQEAIKAAREIADSGERIVVEKATGGERVIRQGR